MKYCLSDVDILKRGCLDFRSKIMKITKTATTGGIDPFQSSLTLASLCHLIYRTQVMKSNSIVIIPEMGFDPTQNYSQNQMIWLKYIAQKDNIRIDHCMNGKEKKIVNYSVDGYCQQTDTVYECLGCFMHGCNKCYTYINDI